MESPRYTISWHTVGKHAMLLNQWTVPESCHLIGMAFSKLLQPQDQDASSGLETEEEKKKREMEIFMFYQLPF